MSGPYGTYTGIVRYYDPVAKEGKELILKNGEVLSEFTGSHWASGATAYDEGKGFWLDRPWFAHTMGSPVGLLLSLTQASSETILGDTRLFVGNASGNKMLWDGTGLSIVGTITATDGSIGGWTINSTYLAKDTGVNATSAGMSPTDFPYYAGATYANRASGTFRVTNAGAMHAESGDIAAWVFTTSAMYKDGATAALSSGMSPVDYPYYAGAKYADRATAPWRVTPAGKMYIEGTLYLTQAVGALVIGSGWTTEPTDFYGVFIGYQAGNAQNDIGQVSIGYQAGSGAVDAGYAIAIGYNAAMDAASSVSATYIGMEAGKSSNSDFCVFIGHQAGKASSGNSNVGVGGGALESCTGECAVAVGRLAGYQSTKDFNVFLGDSCGYQNTGQYGVGIGYWALRESTTDYNVAIGYQSGYGNTGWSCTFLGAATGISNTYEKVVCIGQYAVATANQQIVFGATGAEFTELYGGGGVEQSAVGYASNFRINATGGSGTNAPGGDLRLAGGTATGNAASGAVAIQTAPAGSSGSTKQTLTDRLKVDANGNTYIGDGGATNYAQFDNTGNLTFVGTAQAWDDIRIEPQARTTGANAPTFEKWYDDSGGTSRGAYLYSFDDATAGSEKEVFFTLQMSHAWNGGDVHLHVHWVGAVADTTATPRWGLEYAWKEPGAAYGDTTIIYAVGNEQGDTDITAHKHYITEFTALTPGSTADGLSSILVGRLFRDSANAADTYNAAGAKCGLLYIDGHYQIARIGSTDEYTA